MAEVAHGMNCPRCGTFNAVGGAKSDEMLAGQCGGCGTSVSMSNPSYDPALGAIVAAKDAQIEALQQRVAELEAPQADHGASALPGEGEATEDVDG